MMYSAVNTAAMLIYLCIQSISDIRSSQVYTWLNYLMLMVYGTAYIYANRESPVTYWGLSLSTIAVIIILSVLRVYSSGDMKALIVIFLSYNGAVFELLLTVFFADIFFILENKIIKGHICTRKQDDRGNRGTEQLSGNVNESVNEPENKNKRYPYFPSLLCGYLIILIMRLLL